MEPRKEQNRQPKAADARTEGPKPKFRIVKLEERIAPKLATNHNETLVREPASAKPKAAKVRNDPQPKLQIVKLEQRITPGQSLNHNETLVLDHSGHAR